MSISWLRAVSMMIPIRVLVARIRRQTSNPSIPGSMMSSSATRTSGLSRSLSRASSPVSASMTEYPARVRLMTIKPRILDSSSRTSTFLDMAFLPFSQLSPVVHWATITWNRSASSSGSRARDQVS